MTDPLVEMLRNYLGEETQACPECGSKVFDVALENPEYRVDLENKDVEDLKPFGQEVEIVSVQCHDCGSAF